MSYLHLLFLRAVLSPRLRCWINIYLWSSLCLGLPQSRGGLISPPSGSGAGSELLARHLSLRPAESFQRSQNSGALRHSPLDPSGRTGDPVQGNLFKAPMPPQQEVCGGAGGGRRDPSRPADLNFAGPSQSQDPAFPSSPLSALGSPHRSPYAQMPGTPRPDYSQQTGDPFTQQSPPYINPQTPGTPRPHLDPAYMVAAPALRLEQYSQQPAVPGHRPSPSHQNTDPYSSSPGTPRPSVVERFPRSPGSQRSGEAPSSRALRADPYSQQSAAARAQNPPADGFAPQHGGAAAESFSSAQHQVAHRLGAGLARLSGGVEPASAHCFLLSFAAVAGTTASAGHFSSKHYQPGPKAHWHV